MRRIPVVLLAALMGFPPVALAQSAPRWTLEETLRIDKPGDVRALTIDRRGNLYLGKSGLPWIEVLDSNARPLRRIGSDFIFGANALGWRGDTLWVRVPGLPPEIRRYSLDGRELGSRIRFDRRLASAGASFRAAELLADGSVYPGTVPAGEASTNEYRMERRALRRFSPDGEVVDTIAMIPIHPLPSLFWARNGSTTCCWNRNWFWTWRTQTNLPVIPTADGSAVLFVEERREAGATGTFDLYKVGIAGDTLVRRSIAYTRRVLTEADRAWIRDWHGRYASGELYGDGLMPPSPAVRDANRRAAEDALTYPEAFPPVRWIVAGADGTIWLLREYRTDGADLWEVYDDEGRLQGSVLITEGVTSAPWEHRQDILHATRDEIWVRMRPDGYVPKASMLVDEDWVVRRYRIN